MLSWKCCMFFSHWVLFVSSWAEFSFTHMHKIISMFYKKQEPFYILLYVGVLIYIIYDSISGSKVLGRTETFRLCAALHETYSPSLKFGYTQHWWWAEAMNCALSTSAGWLNALLDYSSVLMNSATTMQCSVPDCKDILRVICITKLTENTTLLYCLITQETPVMLCGEACGHHHSNRYPSNENLQWEKLLQELAAPPTLPLYHAVLVFFLTLALWGSSCQIWATQKCVWQWGEGGVSKGKWQLVLTAPQQDGI